MSPGEGLFTDSAVTPRPRWKITWFSEAGDQLGNHSNPSSESKQKMHLRHQYAICSSIQMKCTGIVVYVRVRECRLGLI